MHIERGEIEFRQSTPYLLRRATRDDAPVLMALHGQGMNAERFLHILRGFPEDVAHLLVPQGPYPFEMRTPDEIRLGYSWYMYRGDQDEFRSYLERGQSWLLELSQQIADRHDIATERMGLLGFSQGGYLAGCAALNHPGRFPALVVASARIKTEIFELVGRTFPKVLVVHGTNDASTTWERAEANVAELRAAGAEVDVELHSDGHRLPKSAVAAIGSWMGRVLDGNS